MSVIEETIDRMVAEAEETLIGLYGEPVFEDEHTETLQAVVGPFADELRKAVEEIERLKQTVAIERQRGDWMRDHARREP